MRIEDYQLAVVKLDRSAAALPVPLSHSRKLARQRNFKPLLSILLLLKLFSGAAIAQNLVLEMIVLEHSSADDILPLIEPFVEGGGSATGTHDQLIIKSSPANIIEIKKVVAAVDRPPKPLRITVRQDVSGASSIQEHALSGQLRSGDLRAGVGDPGLQRGARIGIRDANGNAIQYRSVNTRSNQDNHNSHFVTAVEGHPALILTGESLPVPYSSATYDRYGGVVTEGIDYRDVNSGFYVTARTHGEQVTLEVAPQLERADPGNRGSIDTRYSSTTVSGRLGEWIALGGANDNRSVSGRGLVASTRHHNADIYGVWVKVEQVE